MTVDELIEHLRQYDGGRRVLFDRDEFGLIDLNAEQIAEIPVALNINDDPTAWWKGQHGRVDDNNRDEMSEHESVQAVVLAAEHVL